MRLKDRVAIITGAGRGIGRAIALAYAREGAIMTLAARSAGELEETARLAQELGAATHIVLTDVTKQDDVDEMVRQTVDRFSTVDILVNKTLRFRPEDAEGTGVAVEERSPAYRADLAIAEKAAQGHRA